MIRAILDELMKPDDQMHDWYRWATSQAGHMALVGVPAALALLALHLPAWCIPPVVWFAYGTGWEWFVQKNPATIDGLVDTLMVTFGAAFVVAFHAHGPIAAGLVWCGFLAAILIGIRRRL